MRAVAQAERLLTESWDGVALASGSSHHEVRFLEDAQAYAVTMTLDGRLWQLYVYPQDVDESYYSSLMADLVFGIASKIINAHHDILEAEENA